MRPPTPAEAQLADWLQRLVAELQSQGARTAGLLRRVVAGRRAVIDLDGARLVLSVAAEPDPAPEAASASAHARAARPLQVTITPAAAHEAASVRTRSDTLRAVIDGRLLLDRAVALDLLHLRAELPELLAFHELVLHALALGPRRPGLQALWAEFDRDGPAERPRCNPLGAQAAVHGALRQAVPPCVQWARSPLNEGP